MRRVTLLLGIALIVASCGDDAGETTTSPPTLDTTSTTGVTTTTTQAAAPPETTTTVPPPPLAEVTVELIEVAAGFDQPTFVDTRSGDDRLYVADQSGRIHAVDASGDATLVLGISDRVRFGGERGLLGLAFHPDDPSRMFVHYSRRSDGAGVIEEYRLPLDASAADPEPAGSLLVVPQPAANHNGGMIAFGPDGMLYIAFGDGGGGGDPYRQGQDPTTPLGAILRIDVDGSPYTIPPDNPFADGTAGAGEVWVYGLRNPWRFSFDGHDVWIADVGQGEREEVNLITTADGGSNFGWPILEGTHCYDGPASLCESNDFVGPIFEYSIRGQPRCAIVGGYVYRGNESPVLAGAYLFADHCTGEIMALRVEGASVVDDAVLVSAGERVTSFGTDSDGEIYVVTVRAVYRIVAR